MQGTQSRCRPCVRERSPPDRGNIEQISQALGVFEPIEINSGNTLWHRRVRLIWTNLELAPTFGAWLMRNEEGRLALVVPPAQRVLPDLGRVIQGGFWPSLLEAAGTKEFPEGRFPVFTSRFHPGMEPHGWTKASPEAIQRCQEDGKIWPYYRYEDCFLLWRGEEQRILLPKEIAADAKKKSDKLPSTTA